MKASIPTLVKSRTGNGKRKLTSLLQVHNLVSAAIITIVGTSLFHGQVTVAAGVQSGPHQGNSYAGGMVYDANNDMIYVTGITYDSVFSSNNPTTGPGNDSSSCFVAAIDLNDWDWNDSAVLGNPNILETCQAIGYVAPETLIVGGNSEPGGLENFNSNAAMSAFGLLLNRNQVSSPLTSVSLTAPSGSSKIPYPQWIATHNKDVYVISLTSTDDEISSWGQAALNQVADGSNPYPNWIQTQKYGSSLDMSVTKLSLRQQEFLGIPDGPITVTQEWFQEFPIQGTPRVFIGGVLVKNGRYLVVAGSTRGLGRGYGDAEGDDEDGYISILDLANGDLEPLGGSGDLQRNNIRLGSDANDVLMGICDDPRDPTAFYVTGATLGDVGGIIPNARVPPPGSLQAWIKKIDLQTLEDIWSVQLGARIPGSESPSAIFAAGCAVVGDTVYVGGDAENGAELLIGNIELSSRGGDDIWVAQLDANTGSLNWAKQVGTPGNDNLSRNGGLIADLSGNVLLYGETSGSLYRTKDSNEDPTSTDVFLMVLDSVDGSHADVGAPVEPPTEAPVQTQAPVALPTQAPVAFVPIGQQIQGPIYAGGMVYDARNRRALLTGTQGTSPDTTCFVTGVDLDSGDIEWTNVINEATTNEVCSSLAYSLLEDKIYVIGSTEKDGYLAKQGGLGDIIPEATQIGLLLQIDNEGTDVQRAAVLAEDGATYPISVVAHPNEDAIFVAVSASDSALPSSAGLSEGNLAVGGVQQYGSAYFTGIQRISVDGTGDTSAVEKLGGQDFYAKFAVDDGETFPVFVSGMTMAGNGDTLVVVGSTRGSGGVYGTNTGEDMDGFILKIDPETGNLYGLNGQRSSTRLDSINQKDDWITNICNDRFDNDAFYVIGASKGKVRQLPDNQQPPEGTIHAFVAKVQLESLTAEWLHHFTMQPGVNALAEASAYGCTVTSEDDGSNLVYVAGVVEAGAKMDDATVTPGSAGDDLFIAQMDGGDGTINWIQQVGSSGQERLARGGGIDIDGNGNAIVYAETTGSLFGDRSGAASERSDTILFTMNKADGSYKVPTPDTPLGDVSTDSPVQSPTTQGDLTEAPQDGPTNDFLPDHISAFQTDPDVGPTYAGGMFYDQFTNSIFVTGATYGSFDGPGTSARDTSFCIFGSITLPDLKWRQKQAYGSAGSAEACNALSLSTFDSRATALVIGSAERGGFLSQLGSGGTPLQAGFVLDLANVDGQFQNQGGSVMDSDAVQFPIAITSDNDGNAWVVSMTSQDTEVTSDFQKTGNVEYPNFTTGGIEKYGSQYRIVVERHELLRSGTADGDMVLEKTLQLQWRKPFETADQKAVFVSDMIMVENGKTLVFVGSTLGRSGGDDMDGILAKIRADDGTFAAEGSGSRSVAYFSSVTGRDDFVLSACSDPDDQNAFYIVGATQGKIDQNSDRSKEDITVHAIAAKISVATLTPVWTKQFAVNHADGTDTTGAAAVASGCAVIDGKQAMYIGGVVENGAALEYGQQQSAGRDDLFVAKLDTGDGSIAWLKQVGSNGDDRIAHGGGIKVDGFGNAVVFGDTNGSFYRNRAASSESDTFSDLFVMIFNQDDGAHVPPLIGDPMPHLPNDTSTPQEWYPNGIPQVETSSVGKLFLAAVIVFLVTVGFFCLYGRRQAKKKAEAQKTSIFAYLQHFDVEDIDLRKSPPGGWHGTYMNKLAYGINQGETGRLPDVDDSVETMPLTHSSVVRDSLFMESAATPTLGFSDAARLDGGLDEFTSSKSSAREEKESSLKVIV